MSSQNHQSCAQKAKLWERKLCQGFKHLRLVRSVAVGGEAAAAYKWFVTANVRASPRPKAPHTPTEAWTQGSAGIILWLRVKFLTD